ncbi:TPA: hypothetical protein JRX31_001443 [Elizabethkingia anophelis]|nr:hypothetical protein [Elizabethkingia anophelis]
MKIDKNALANGEIIEFENEDFNLELSHNETLSGGKAFKVYFNGAFVTISKTFKPLEKKALELINKHNLQPVSQLYNGKNKTSLL